jgi:septal ring factor EnvC (AmiA/AmiB activator)
MEKPIDLTRTFAMQAPADLMTVDLDAITKNAREIVDAVDAANKKAPTDRELESEFYDLKRKYEEATFHASQAEKSCNRAAARVRYFEDTLKKLKATVPESEYERLMAKFRAGERVYGYSQIFKAITSAEQDVFDARNFFHQMQRINNARAQDLKRFKEHSLPRLNELQALVAQADENYSILKNTARRKGLGRW